MESTEAALTRYTTYSRVLAVEERSRREWISGVGDKATFRDVSTGFFVLFEGSYEAIHLGFEPPAFAVGDKVKISFEKVTDDNHI